jgi:hypothetical protein
VADLQPQQLGYESDVQCRTDNTRLFVMVAGKKRMEKEVLAMRSAPVCLCSEWVPNSLSKYTDRQNSVKENSAFNARMTYCVHSSR